MHLLFAAPISLTTAVVAPPCGDKYISGVPTAWKCSACAERGICKSRKAKMAKNCFFMELKSRSVGVGDVNVIY